MTRFDGTAAEASSAFSAPLRPPLRPPEPVSLEPASAYEAVTRQMVIGLSEDLREIKTRLNGLLFMVAGSLLLDLAMRLTLGR